MAIWLHTATWNGAALADSSFENPDIAANITRQTPPTFLLQNEDDHVDRVEDSLSADGPCDLRKHCSPARTQRPEGYRLRCQAGHHSRLVSAPGRTEAYGSRRRSYPGRPRTSPEIEVLVVHFARENRGRGYDSKLFSAPGFIVFKNGEGVSSEPDSGRPGRHADRGTFEGIDAETSENAPHEKHNPRRHCHGERLPSR
jgi:hypothetical protein